MEQVCEWVAKLYCTTRWTSRVFNDQEKSCAYSSKVRQSRNLLPYSGVSRIPSRQQRLSNLIMWGSSSLPSYICTSILVDLFHPRWSEFLDKVEDHATRLISSLDPMPMDWSAHQRPITSQEMLVDLLLRIRSIFSRFPLCHNFTENQKLAITTQDAQQAIALCCTFLKNLNPFCLTNI